MALFFAQDKLQIAIIDLEPQNISTITSSVISDFLRNDLFDTKKFIVVERNQNGKYIKRTNISTYGLHYYRMCYRSGENFECGTNVSR